MSQDPKPQTQESKPEKKEGRPIPGGVVDGARARATDSLRDHFASQALVGLLCQPGASTKPASLAESAYRLADAMLAARPKGEA